MRLSESQMILQLKAQFFDITNQENKQTDFDRMIEKMLITLKSVLDAAEVTFIKCNEWKKVLYVKSSTNQTVIDRNIRSLSCAELAEKLTEKQLIRNNIPLLCFQDYHLLLPLWRKEIVGYLLVKGKKQSQYDGYGNDFFMHIQKAVFSFVIKAQTIANIVLEDMRYKQLYRVTSKFHSSMDMDDILGEIIVTLQEVYPSFTHLLLLSQDSSCDCTLPVKELQYDNENITAMQAYLTGTVQIEKCQDKHQSILYAPLKGRQGVYGILQVNAPNTVAFPKSEIKFIELLANTAGSALENAQLYQQSKRLIADLQLINEISHRLNSHLRLNDSMSYMQKQIITSFAAEEVGFILFSNGKDEMQILPGSTEFFQTAEANKYITYMSDKIRKERDAFFIGDLSLQTTDLNHITYRSIMGIPMIESDELKGFAIVLHQAPYHFSFDSFKLLQSLIHHSTLAVTNSLLHEELEKMVITDHLTKLYSRNYLDDMIQISMKNDAQGTFILIDIDDFKQINDTYGHQVGDEVLIQVANIIKNNIRDTDIAARWGGEEIGIYLPRIELQAGIAIADRFLQSVAKQTEPKVTISIGVSYWKSSESDSVKSLFQRADQALYKAKRTGKNKIIIQDE